MEFREIKKQSKVEMKQKVLLLIALLVLQDTVGLPF